MNAPRIPLAAMLAVILAPNGWAVITPLFFDDFESGTPVGAVEDDNYDPPGWAVTESANRSVQVYDSGSSAGINSPAGNPGTSGNYVRLRRDLGETPQSTLTRSVAPHDSLNQWVRLAFRVWVVGSAASERGVEVFTDGGTMDPYYGVSSQRSFNVRFHADGSIKAIENGVLVTIAGAGSFPLNQWVQVLVESNLAGSGYKLVINSAPYDRPARASVASNNIALVGFGELATTSAGAGYAFIDNAKLERDIITVGNANDSGAGSLRQALLDSRVGGTIHFDPALDGQTIPLTSGQLVALEAVTIDASSLAGGLTIDAGGGSRVLNVDDGATLRNLRFTGGVAPDNAANAFGHLGGGMIHLGGDLLLEDCVISGNRAGDGGAGSNGAGGSGGGIYSRVGDLYLVDCEISDNDAGIGGPLGQGGNGGGLCRDLVSSGPQTRLTRCTILKNRAGSGSESYFNPGSTGGDGGGLWLRRNGLAIILEACTIADNRAGNGGDLLAAAINDPALSEAYAGDGGSGGGIFYQDSTTAGVGLDMIACSVTGNQSGRGGDGLGDTTNCLGGKGGDGGGLALFTASSGFKVRIEATTVARNTTGRGGAGSRSSSNGNDALAIAGDGGDGGGIFSAYSVGGSSVVDLFLITLAENSTGAAGSAGPLIGTGVGGSGGGIYNATMNAGHLHVGGCILSSNSAAGSGPDVEGGFTEAGPNLPLGSDPRLAPLGDYGGFTPSMPLLPGSPAIDQIVTAIALPDQRSLVAPDYLRVLKDGNGDAAADLDLGAVEYDPATDIALYWPLDFDGDGSPFGVEHALGTDPLQSDPDDPRNLHIALSGGYPQISFGLDTAAPGVGAWTLERSPDLSPASWQQVYLFNGVTENPAAGILSVLGPDSVTLTDQTPPVPRAFYRFRPLPEPQ